METGCNQAEHARREDPVGEREVCYGNGSGDLGLYLLWLSLDTIALVNGVAYNRRRHKSFPHSSLEAVLNGIF